MSANRNDQVTIRQYLLGQLTGEELDRFEEQLFVDDELAEELLASEDELIDESIAGELGGEEAKRFAKYFLLTEDRRQNLWFRKALKRTLKPRVPVTVPSPVQRKQNWMYWVTASVAAVVVVAFIASPALRHRVFPPEQRTFTLLTLTAGSVDRATGGVSQKIKLPLHYDDLKLQLTLPETSASTPAKGYRVEMLKDDGGNKTLQPVVRNGPAIEVVIPAREFKIGLYDFHVFVIKPDNIEERVSGSYQLAVE